MENKFFDQNRVDIKPHELGDAIQQAIEIEIATIPTYLYTYYSINRTPDQNAIYAALMQKLLEKIPLKKAAEKALSLSVEIMVFANKAAALIMSVAIEEMLHMALSSNLKQALAGMPELVGKSPIIWPTHLPGQIPHFEINKAKFSAEQLCTFLHIEKPQSLPDVNLETLEITYKTIGEFYEMIKDYINNNDLYFNDLPQLIECKSYYAQSNIDTVYYDKEHKPQFTNQDDSGDLIYINDIASAIKAIECIVDQGEGYEVNDKIEKYDDLSKKEMSHYEKFKEIHSRYKYLNEQFADLGIGDLDIGQYFVHNVAKNPLTQDYPATIAPVSDLLNAIYTYIFVMIENCYVLSGNTQWEVFMFGIHKSMIFILNSICGDIMLLSYTAPNGNKYAAAPTFENYQFNLKISSPKLQIIELFKKAVAVYPEINYLEPRISNLPDVPLNPILNNRFNTVNF